uniref:Uncharacterized protein n=1 Tax=Panagrolaimus sp. JU765 TaxID=591449 RepID=A0AC34PY32_9BILA
MLKTGFYIDLVEGDFETEFEAIFEMFKKIQSGFDAYLQKRKLNSPRLHFLSNNELLELLSKAKNPELIGPYLPKLFAAITKPDFNNRGEIVAVFAADGESTSSVAKIIDVSTADLAAIAQEYFLLAGFKESKRCSLDLTTILGQCSSIITPMRHYDFHLRTVLAVVKNAIWLKNKETNVSESGATVKAIQNILLPIFSKYDGKMFLKLLFLSKVKPKMTDFETDYKTAIVGVCEFLKLEPTQKFVDACYSLYLQSRHHCAVILFGNSLTGKSAVVDVVRELLKQKDGIRCEIALVSPSLHNPDSLFGRFDSKKLEWTRGVLTQKLVDVIPDGTERWIHVDGVVDSLWVETLNSLLDDNKKVGGIHNS